MNAKSCRLFYSANNFKEQNLNGGLYITIFLIFLMILFVFFLIFLNLPFDLPPFSVKLFENIGSN